MNRTYTVFGSLLHKQTSETTCTIERTFDSICLAKIYQIEMKLLYPEMSFSVEMNRNLEMYKLSNFEQNSAQLN